MRDLIGTEEKLNLLLKCLFLKSHIESKKYKVIKDFISHKYTSESDLA